MTSLREQKKRETARNLSSAAYLLARSLGFETVTTEAIAAKVGVSRRTFSNYYANKHAAVVDGFAEELGIPAGPPQPVNNPSHLPQTFAELIDTSEAFITELFTDTAKIAHIQAFAKMVQDHPTLEPYIHAVFLEFQSSPIFQELTRIHGQSKVTIFVGAAMGTLSGIIRMILGPLALPQNTPPLRTEGTEPPNPTPHHDPPTLGTDDLHAVLTYITEAFTYLRHGFITE